MIESHVTKQLTLFLNWWEWQEMFVNASKGQEIDHNRRVFDSFELEPSRVTFKRGGIISGRPRVTVYTWKKFRTTTWSADHIGGVGISTQIGQLNCLCMAILEVDIDRIGLAVLVGCTRYECTVHRSDLLTSGVVICQWK
jgi:hypothetical protein